MDANGHLTTAERKAFGRMLNKLRDDRLIAMAPQLSIQNWQIDPDATEGGSVLVDLNHKVTHAQRLHAFLLGGRHLRSTRFLPVSSEVSAVTKASQELMDLVRLHRELGLSVIQLRDAGSTLV